MFCAKIKDQTCSRSNCSFSHHFLVKHKIDNRRLFVFMPVTVFSQLHRKIRCKVAIDEALPRTTIAISIADIALTLKTCDTPWLCALFISARCCCFTFFCRIASILFVSFPAIASETRSGFIYITLHVWYPVWLDYLLNVLATCWSSSTARNGAVIRLLQILVLFNERQRQQLRRMSPAWHANRTCWAPLYHLGSCMVWSRAR